MSRAGRKLDGGEKKLQVIGQRMDGWREWVDSAYHFTLTPALTRALEKAQGKRMTVREIAHSALQRFIEALMQG